MQTGSWQRYHENGQLSDEGEYSAGKKIGEWTYYSADGKIKKKNIYKSKA
jgi:antitoxin component YwqK of YwqJK toxin-antitoxin module